jgi:hypothetical protein
MLEEKQVALVLCFKHKILTVNTIWYYFIKIIKITGGQLEWGERWRERQRERRRLLNNHIQWFNLTVQTITFKLHPIFPRSYLYWNLLNKYHIFINIYSKIKFGIKKFQTLFLVVPTMFKYNRSWYLINIEIQDITTFKFIEGMELL